VDWLVVLAVLVTAGCGGTPDGLPGGIGRSCSSDATCPSGLVCLSQICVQPAAAGAGGGGVGGGNGGAGGGNAGTGGAGARPCTPATTLPAPAGGLIADFMGPDGGVNLGGGLFVYPSSGPAAPGIATDGGALYVTENQAATAAPQYVGAGLYFTSCIDASAFTGVSFSVSGAFSGCSMQFSTGDVEHQDRATTSGFATGVAGDYPPQTAISMGDVTSAPQVVKVPFGPTAISGNPATSLDPQKIILVLWQLTIPPATPTDGAPAACSADLTIDDVTFY
jgi:hypothetical protein